MKSWWALDETVEPVGVSQILRVIPKPHTDGSLLKERITELERLAVRGDITGVIDHLGEIVPTYAPDGMPSGSGVTPLAK